MNSTQFADNDSLANDELSWTPSFSEEPNCLEGLRLVQAGTTKPVTGECTLSTPWFASSNHMHLGRSKRNLDPIGKSKNDRAVRSTSNGHVLDKKIACDRPSTGIAFPFAPQSANSDANLDILSVPEASDLSFPELTLPSSPSCLDQLPNETELKTVASTSSRDSCKHMPFAKKSLSSAQGKPNSLCHNPPRILLKPRFAKRIRTNADIMFDLGLDTMIPENQKSNDA